MAMQNVGLAQDTDVPKNARLLTRQVRPFHISADDPTATQNVALRHEMLPSSPLAGKPKPKGKPFGMAVPCADRGAVRAAALPEGRRAALAAAAGAITVPELTVPGLMPGAAAALGIAAARTTVAATAARIPGIALNGARVPFAIMCHLPVRRAPEYAASAVSWKDEKRA
jgi:hypothetical protein